MMKLTEKQQWIIDTVQWILIGVMIVVCTAVYIGVLQVNDRSAELVKDNSYIKIYSSHRIDELTKENKKLNDSIIVLNNRLEEIEKNE